MDKPLVTVGVLTYNNYQYIKDAINSILTQTYPNIELIVSDDGSTEFDVKEIEKYIFDNKGDNIKRVLVNQMKKNGGTSKNFNYVLSQAHGKYIKYLAADDFFIKENSLINLVEVAENNKSKVVAGRCPSYDQYLQRWEWTYPSDDNWRIITNLSKWDLFGVMSEFCLISAPGVLYQTEYLRNKGGADESYRLIEDWPLWLRMIREGDKITFTDDLVVLYRAGGVSNGINNEAYGRHQIEYADVIRNESFPYKKKIKRKYYRRAWFSERKHRHDGIKALYGGNFNLIQKVKLELSYADMYLYYFYYCIMKQIVERGMRKKKKIFEVGIITIVIGMCIDYERIINLLNMSTVLLEIGRLGVSGLIILGGGMIAVAGILYAIHVVKKIGENIGAVIYGWK